MVNKKKNPILDSWHRGWKVIGRLFLPIVPLYFLVYLILPCGVVLLVAICGGREVLYCPIGIFLTLLLIPLIYDIFNQSTGLLSSSGKCFDNNETVVESIQEKWKISLQPHWHRRPPTSRPSPTGKGYGTFSRHDIYLTKER